jgi:hypothetical protein
VRLALPELAWRGQEIFGDHSQKLVFSQTANDAKIRGTNQSVAKATAAQNDSALTL